MQGGFGQQYQQTPPAAAAAAPAQPAAAAPAQPQQPTFGQTADGLKASWDALPDDQKWMMGALGIGVPAAVGMGTYALASGGRREEER